MAGPLGEPVTRGADCALGGLGASGARSENALRYVLGNAERWRDGASGDEGGEVEVASRRAAGMNHPLDPARSICQGRDFPWQVTLDPPRRKIGGYGEPACPER